MLLGNRIGVLDALRGIAAGGVLLHHCFSVLAETTTASVRPFLTSVVVTLTPFGVVANGRAAVILFFVLSGYVLCISVLRQETAGYPEFLLKRFCRIWIPATVSVLLGASLWLLVRPGNVVGFTAYLYAFGWIEEPTSQVLLAHSLFLVLGDEESVQLNKVLWSLVHELRISVIFPLLVVFACRSPWVVIPAAVLFQICVDVLLVTRPEGWISPSLSSSLIGSLLVTCHFIGSFMIGILAALYASNIKSFLARAHVFITPIIWLCSFWLLFFPMDTPASLGAGALIVLSVNSPTLGRILAGRSFQCLGRVSYSLYLVHLPIILAAVHVFAGSVPPLLVVFSAGLLALPVAALFYHFVERPSHLFGRRLVARFLPI